MAVGTSEFGIHGNTSLQVQLAVKDSKALGRLSLASGCTQRPQFLRDE